MRTQKFTRRSFLTGATGLSMATTLGTPVRSAAKLGLRRPSSYRFEVGAFEITSVLDGAVQLPGPHPMFGENVSAKEVAELANKSFLPSDMMEIPFTVTLINTGEALILLDTGTGVGRRPNAGKLLERLADDGIAPGDVTHVVITHFHGDHIGGLMEDGAPAFPNAAYTFPAAEFDFWSNSDLLTNDATAGNAALVRSNIIPFADMATMAVPGDTVVSGIELVDAAGHTPGHCVVHLESEGERLLISADTANHHVMSLQNPDWHFQFDMDKEAAVVARKTVFGMVAADRIPFLGYHMPPPAVGYVEVLGNGFRYVPASYQLNL